MGNKLKKTQEKLKGVAARVSQIENVTGLGTSTLKSEQIEEVAARHARKGSQDYGSDAN